MTDTKISFEPTTSVATQLEDGQISHLAHSETVTIYRPANHNEVSIMESTWRQIKRKANSISLKAHLDISSIIIGALIPYLLDIITDYCNKTSPNYFPIAICGALLFFTNWLSKKVPFFGSDNTAKNQVHLEDLKALIDEVDCQP